MKRYLTVLQAIVPLALLVVALWVLQKNLQTVSWREVVTYFRTLPLSAIGLAILVTTAAYLVLTLYDFFGTRYAGSAIAWRKVAPASYIAYAFSNSIGHPLVTGTPIRVRFYSAEGIDGIGIAKIVSYCLGGFWLGFAALGGITLCLAPASMLEVLPFATEFSRVTGAALIVVTLGYLVAALRVRKAFTFRDWKLQLPSLRSASAQLAIGVADWCLAASVLYLVFPASTDVSLAFFGVCFLVANATGLLSGVPGGIGIFETVMVVAMEGHIAAPSVLGALVIFRTVYYVAPLVGAALLLAWHEYRRQEQKIAQGLDTLDRIAPALVPAAFSIVTFAAGTILLIGGATPTPHRELAWLASTVGVPVVQFAHFVTSLVGAALLLLTRALQHRITSAWRAALWLFGIGIVTTLLRGLDWGSAILLLLLLVATAAVRREFYRHAPFSEARFTPGSATTVLMAFTVVIFLTLLAHRSSALGLDLLFDFSVTGHAARSLRALIGVSLLSLGATWSLVRASSSPVPLVPSESDLTDARRIVARYPRSHAHLALLGDKRLLFDSQRRGFLMFRVERRSWVSFGDPVAPSEVADELVWTFRDLAARQGGWAVFYGAREENAARYIGLGLAFMRIGEEARIRLEEFDPTWRDSHIAALDAVRDAGLVFDVILPENVEPIVDELRPVAAAWLAARGIDAPDAALGVCDRRYLERGPIGVFRQGEAIVAFANVWLSGENEEASIDLIRYLPSVPTGTMLALVVELATWARDQHYQWFSLGLAPHRGIDPTRRSPAWNRAASVLYRHGEHFEDFQYLREFKESFVPVWEGRYLASPGDLRLANILRDVTRLVSGSTRGALGTGTAVTRQSKA
ncbi:MAG: bifunctional lysylphosphatidylglycerol flippase/synthetase MprF [Thermoanaerobaculia bacterium]|nr:bifunctional lysylphosphatidylglycerol flippase/synthetase MprF [Thermoanaerobaculia bacterium]